MASKSRENKICDSRKLQIYSITSREFYPRSLYGGLFTIYNFLNVRMCPFDYTLLRLV